MLYAHVNKQPVMLPGGDQRGRDYGEDIVAGGKSLIESVFGGLFGGDDRRDHDLGTPSRPSDPEATGSTEDAPRPRRTRKKTWLEELFE
jgi:hypothetical protein